MSEELSFEAAQAKTRAEMEEALDAMYLELEELEYNISIILSKMEEL